MLLYKEMHAMQRLPALFFQNPGKNLKELYLSDYEVLNNEPLHDVSHHIEHLYEELPHPIILQRFRKISERNNLKLIEW